ncbi:potassium transport protein 1 [Ascobolus immersus RN42]|uniref:Potassium transport protein 1 n=1 Tax=Ascobolus immersus RN42 TaxID=1160509 RepID=A0A3N4I3B4_ASCIM|nr:potassium transport protein 1 [Ascobolus immersus RN42]
MWTPPVNFITLHYAYIILLGIVGLIVIHPYGNVSAIDSYFFGVSSSTESGLNPIDLKELKLYQQLVTYFLPIVSNIGFVNIIVVVVRLYWFEKRLNEVGPSILAAERERHHSALHNNLEKQQEKADSTHTEEAHVRSYNAPLEKQSEFEDDKETEESRVEPARSPRSPQISFAPDPRRGESEGTALYIPSPREQQRGMAVREATRGNPEEDEDEISPAPTRRRSFPRRGSSDLKVSKAVSIERIASSLFVLGPTNSTTHDHSETTAETSTSLLPKIKPSDFRKEDLPKLTRREKDELGGLEYTSLKLLLKIVFGYFFGLHVFGAICLTVWIQFAPQKYKDILAESAINKSWWGLYSAQTMVNNLGFSLTPDSMISFRDATFPMIVMTFLAYAGNTFYPCFLRLYIWLITLVTPSESAVRPRLKFLLQHPRRCYTLLFPSRATWILASILALMNIIDIILIITLDLDNPAVNVLPMGPRVLAAIYQSASARHTGTAVFNLAEVHPGVQFSLMVMMYISVFPIAVSIRASNTYEERTIGVFRPAEEEVEDGTVRSYLLTHMQNQLSFDLWYIFLGAFCICVGESTRIMDLKDPAFSVFSIIFEVVSAYGNVGLSLGHPTVMTSLSGQFKPFGKLVICAMMIRGRHRGLPYKLDRAILLPSEREVEDRAVSRSGAGEDVDVKSWKEGVRMRKALTC